MSSKIRNLKSPFLTTRCLYWGVDLPVDQPIWALTVEISNHPFLTTRYLYWRGRSASWSANMSSNSRNLKSPFLTTRCLYWGIDLPVNWPKRKNHLTSNMLKSQVTTSWPLDASTGGVDLLVDLANMSSNSRNLKSPFLTTRCLYQGGRSASWSANMSSNSRNLKSPFLTNRGLYWGVDLPVDLANMSSNSRNLKSPFLTTRCLYWG